MNTHNNYEPTSRVNYERTTPNPYLHDTYLPPPPPEYYMHQRTGKAWKVAIPVVLLLLGVAVGILVYPVVNARLNPSSDVLKATPYVPFGLPAVTPEPTANTGYTARDIMQDIFNTGDKPWLVTYDQEINGMNGPLSVNATSSVDFIVGPANGQLIIYSIIVYKNDADTNQAYEYEIKAIYQITPSTVHPSGYPYVHGRCLLLLPGYSGGDTYAQGVDKYCT